MQTDPSHSPSPQVEAGSVAGLWRYPVKSMVADELNAAEVTDRGLVGRTEPRRGGEIAGHGGVAAGTRFRTQAFVGDHSTEYIGHGLGTSSASFLPSLAPPSKRDDPLAHRHESNT